MTYFFCFLIWLCGSALHVLQVVKKLRTQFPEFNAGLIWKTFFAQEWDSLMCSGVLLLLYEVGLYITVWNHIHVAAWFVQWGQFAAALLGGYAGQRIAYKYLNTAVEELEKKADMIRNETK